MPVPTSTSSANAVKRGFLIEFVDGALRSELFAGADAGTLAQYARALSAVAQELVASATPPVIPVETKGYGTSDEPERGSSQQSRGTSSEFVLPNEVVSSTEASDSLQEASTEIADPVAVMWMAEGIDEWLENGAINFSKNTWTYSYEPSFRIVRELLANARRDVPKADGTIIPNQLDVRMSTLTRGDIKRLAKQMQQMPDRQGKRNDGVEAPSLVAQAAVKRLPLQTPNNVAQRFRHVLPWVAYAADEEWVSAGVLVEFKKQMTAADSRAAKAAVTHGVHKPGAVALTRDDLKATYESKAYLDGAIQCDWKHWNDPIRLYTAARVSEVAQLLTNDIIMVAGVPCFYFVNDAPPATAAKAGQENEFAGMLSGASSYEEYRRLKNDASRRIIPVAPALLAMGFMDFVRDRQELLGGRPGMLFARLNWQAKSGFGRRPSEHTLDLLKSANVWVSRRKVGHSLRPTCSQELQRVGMDGELLDRYLGHTTGTERDEAYNETDSGPAYPVKRALEFLQQVDFGVGFPTYAEIKAKRCNWAWEKQLSRKNSYAARTYTS